jgi:hypothetical protein
VVAIDPGYTQGLAFLALQHYRGRRYDSAAVWADSAVAVDPTYLLARTVAGDVAMERGDFARARAAVDAARRLSTEVEVVNALAQSAELEARAGAEVRAREILRSADSLGGVYSPTPLHTALYLAIAHAWVGDAAGAVAWLRRYAPTEDLHFQLHLRCDPPLDRLRSDSSFEALIDRKVPAACS